MTRHVYLLRARIEDYSWTCDRHVIAPSLETAVSCWRVTMADKQEQYKGKEFRLVSAEYVLTPDHEWTPGTVTPRRPTFEQIAAAEVENVLA